MYSQSVKMVEQTNCNTGKVNELAVKNEEDEQVAMASKTTSNEDGFTSCVKAPQ